jgi:hypothetical protein
MTRIPFDLAYRIIPNASGFIVVSPGPSREIYRKWGEELSTIFLKSPKSMLGPSNFLMARKHIRQAMLHRCVVAMIAVGGGPGQRGDLRR